MLPLRIAVDLFQPSPPIESSLHLMLIPFVQIRHRSMDLACHPGLGPLLKTVRVQGTTTAVTFVTVAVRKNAIWNDSFLATRLATVEGPVHGDHLLLNDWNFHRSHIRNTRCDSHQGGHLRNTKCDSHQGGHLRNTRCDSHQEGHPLQEIGILTKGVTLSKANGIRIKRVTLSRANRIRFSPPSTANGIRFKGVPFSTAHGIRIKRATLSKANGIPTKRVTLSKRMGFASRGSPSPKRMGFASGAGPSCSKRPLSRDSSPRPRFSRDSLSPKGFASVPKRMGFASRDSSPKRQRFESRDSDSPRRRHSFRASSREASVERPQSRSSPSHPYSPLRQDKEAEDTSMPAPVKDIMDFEFFTEQGSGFPLSAHFYQEGIANKRSLKSCLESYNFLT